MPASVGDLPVLCIATGAFTDNDDLESVTVSDDVETIEFIYDDTDYTYAQLLAMAGAAVAVAPRLRATNSEASTRSG